jgi:hypothetical protein
VTGVQTCALPISDGTKTLNEVSHARISADRKHDI